MGKVIWSRERKVMSLQLGKMGALLAICRKYRQKEVRIPGSGRVPE